MDQWQLIDDAEREDGDKQRDVAVQAMAATGTDGGCTRLRYAGREYVLRLEFTRAATGLITAVLAELLDGDGLTVVEAGLIKPVIPAPSLARMDPWGRTGVRQGVRQVLRRAAARADSAVS